MVNKRLRQVVSVMRDRECHPELHETICSALRTSRLRAPVTGAMQPLANDVRGLGEASAAEVAFALFLVIEDAGAWDQVERWARKAA